MSFDNIPTVDITLLKDELIALVSLCLMREPAIPLLNKTLNKRQRQECETIQHNNSVQESTNPNKLLQQNITDKIRLLVHKISLHDGEFVLKLALYVRHELNLRKIANYIAALCAREVNCLPYLQCYLEKIIVLPSDWLAIANFAYFYDNDAAHITMSEQLTHPNSLTSPITFSLQAQNKKSSYNTSKPETVSMFKQTNKHFRKVQSNKNDCNMDKYNKNKAEICNKGKCVGRSNSMTNTCADPYKPRIPHALRVALVACFAKFNEFSLAKYNNEKAVHKHCKQAKRKSTNQVLDKLTEQASSDRTSNGTSVSSVSSLDNGTHAKVLNGTNSNCMNLSFDDVNDDNNSNNIKSSKEENILPKKYSTNSTNSNNNSSLEEESVCTEPYTTLHSSISMTSSEHKRKERQTYNWQNNKEEHERNKVNVNVKTHKINNNNNNNNNKHKETATSLSHHVQTFTYKQLVRMLHITKPAFAVCCLLGKRYPRTHEEFIRMGLNEVIDNTSTTTTTTASNSSNNVEYEHEKEQNVQTISKQHHEFDQNESEATSIRFREFNPLLAGTRMKLPRISTWETRLSAEGNHGSVWDALVRSNELPFMAALRNLRNILTHNCCYDTHRTLLLRLQSEKEVALSRQLPYRFYSAYKAVGDVEYDYKMTREWLYSKLQVRRQVYKEQRDRVKKIKEEKKKQRKCYANRAVAKQRLRLEEMFSYAYIHQKVGMLLKAKTKGVISNSRNKRYHHCEFPLLSEVEMHRWMKRYKFALNSAISIATKLNVTPMPGYSVVVLCLRKDLLTPLQAHGAGAISSIRTKLEVAVLLIIMMKYMCEHCTILLAWNDEYTEWNTCSFHSNNFLENVEKFANVCKRIITNGHIAADDEREIEQKEEREEIIDKDRNKEINSEKEKESESTLSFFDSDKSSSSFSSEKSVNHSYNNNKINSNKNKNNNNNNNVGKEEEKEMSSDQSSNRENKCNKRINSFDTKSECEDDWNDSKCSICSFPFSFFDKVIEKETNLEALLVIDMGHYAYDDDNSCNNEHDGANNENIANEEMNVYTKFKGDDKIAHNHRANTECRLRDSAHNVYRTIGDLPVYLSRLRRTCSPNLVYVGLSIAEPTKSYTRHIYESNTCNNMSGTCSSNINNSNINNKNWRYINVMNNRMNDYSTLNVRSRFTHANDVLLSGFSEAVLRVIVERAHGGARAVIERADSTYNVSKLCTRLDANLREEQRKALQMITQIERAQQKKVMSINDKWSSSQRQEQQEQKYLHMELVPETNVVNNNNNNNNNKNIEGDKRIRGSNYGNADQESFTIMGMTNTFDNATPTLSTTTSPSQHVAKLSHQNELNVNTVHVPTLRTSTNINQEAGNGDNFANSPIFTKLTTSHNESNYFSNNYVQDNKPVKFDWTSIEQQNEEAKRVNLPNKSPYRSTLASTTDKAGSEHEDLYKIHRRDATEIEQSKPIILHPTPYITLARATSDEEGARHLRYALRNSHRSANSSNIIRSDTATIICQDNDNIRGNNYSINHYVSRNRNDGNANTESVEKSYKHKTRHHKNVHECLDTPLQITRNNNKLKNNQQTKYKNTFPRLMSEPLSSSSEQEQEEEEEELVEYSSSSSLSSSLSSAMLLSPSSSAPESISSSSSSTLPAEQISYTTTNMELHNTVHSNLKNKVNSERLAIAQQSSNPLNIYENKQEMEQKYDRKQYEQEEEQELSHKLSKVHYPKKHKHVYSNSCHALPIQVTLPTYHECRFFISSTFLDMNNERSALVLDVFPRLRRWAAKMRLRVNIVEVDLRWGITEWDTLENLSTSTCLNEVSRCAPFFLGILGSRYGSCPKPLHVVVDEDVQMSDYDWLHELHDADSVSVTELEMRHGLYNSCKRLRCTHPPTTVFLSRDYHSLQDSLHSASVSARAVYRYESNEAEARLANLKTYLRSHGVNIINYKAEYNALQPELTCSHLLECDGNAQHESTKMPQWREFMMNAHVIDNCSHDEMINHANTKSKINSSNNNNSNDDDDVDNDDLGKWSSNKSASAALQRRFNILSANSHILPSLPNNSVDVSSTTVSSPSLLAWRASDAKRTCLTSEDVPLDMHDFIDKAFHALQHVIAEVCGLRAIPQENIMSNINNNTTTTTTNNNNKVKANKEQHERLSSHREKCNMELVPQETQVTHDEQYHRRKSPYDTPETNSASSFYASIYVDLRSFINDLCHVYIPPHGLIEQLASFALTGKCHVMENNDNLYSANMNWQIRQGQYYQDQEPTSLIATNVTNTGQDFTRASITEKVHNAAEHAANVFVSSRLGLELTRQESNILVLEGSDGSGKSSAMAALARHLFALLPDHMHLVYYSMQAGNDSTHSFLLFLALSLVLRVGLSDEFVIHDDDSVGTLLQQLPLIYHAIKERKCNVIIVLDSLESTSESDELLKCLGLLVHAAAGPETRFLIATNAYSPFANALQTRIPPVISIKIPALNMSERAQFIRRHLALYGKKLQETMELNEISGLLHKREAGNPNYLMAAVMYLRLFSTFDTLRADMRAMPSSIALLHHQLFKTLEAKFDSDTCRLVLTTLYLRQSAGGIMEYNLYRLVSNVAVATRLVALLMGVGVTSHHGLLQLKSSSFAYSIASTYLARECDRTAAYERMLAAELLHQPLTQLYRYHNQAEWRYSSCQAWNSSTPTLLTASAPVLSTITPTPLLFGSTRAAPSFARSEQDESREVLRLITESITRQIKASKNSNNDTNNNTYNNKDIRNGCFSTMPHSCITHPGNPFIVSPANYFASCASCQTKECHSCLFNPVQYSPRELLGILQCAVQAKRADIIALLVSYLPFLEVLLPAPGMLHRLLSLLIQASHENTLATRKLYPLINFFQRKYHVLSIRPDLIRPCVLNSFVNECPISRWGLAQLTELAEQSKRELYECESNLMSLNNCNGSSNSDNKENTKICSREENGQVVNSTSYGVMPQQEVKQERNQECGSVSIKESNKISSSNNNNNDNNNSNNNNDNTDTHPNTLSQFDNKSLHHNQSDYRSQRWVHWLNTLQHGGENREAVARPVTQRVLCMDINTTIIMNSSTSTPSEGRLSECGIAELALGCADGLIRLTSRASPEIIHATLRHVNAVTALCFVPHQANVLVSGCASGLLYVWSLVDNTLLQIGVAHLRQISSIACHPRENVLVTGGLDSYCMMWKMLRSGRVSLEDALEAHETNNNNNNNNSSCGSDHNRTQKNNINHITTSKHQERYLSSFSSSWKRSAEELYRLRIKFGTIGLNTSRLAFRPFLVLRHHSCPVSSVAFHSSGEVLATAAWDGSVYLINVTEFDDGDDAKSKTSRSETLAKQTLEEELLNSATSDTSEKDEFDFTVPHIASESDVVLPSHNYLPYVYKKFNLNGPARIVRFAPSLVITCIVGGYNGQLTLLDYAGNQVQAIIGSLHQKPLTCINYSNDGRQIVTGDESGVMKVSYAGVTGTELCTLNGHRGAITNALFFSNEFAHSRGSEKNLTSASNSISRSSSSSIYKYDMNYVDNADVICNVMSIGCDKTLQLWSVHEVSTTKRIPSSHPAKVTSILFSDDGKYLLTGCASGVLLVFKRHTYFASKNNHNYNNHHHNNIIDDCVDSSNTNDITDDDDELDKSSSWNNTTDNCLLHKEEHTDINNKHYSGYYSNNSNEYNNKFAELEKEHQTNNNIVNDDTFVRYEPRFHMTHEHHRITSLAFALYNTRIVVGLANGELYIWAASPGLNRREGRLLARVHVPLRGCYPVIAITSNLLITNHINTSCVTNKINTKSKKADHIEETEGYNLQGNIGKPFSNVNVNSTSSNLLGNNNNTSEDDNVNKTTPSRASAAHITALCSHGEILSFDLFDKTVSLALLQRHEGHTNENNKYEEHNVRTKENIFNATNVPDYESSKEINRTSHNQETKMLSGECNKKVNNVAEEEVDQQYDNSEQLVYMKRNTLHWLDLIEEESITYVHLNKDNVIHNNKIHYTRPSHATSHDATTNLQKVTTNRNLAKNANTMIDNSNYYERNHIIECPIKGEEIISLLQLSFHCKRKREPFAAQLTVSPPIFPLNIVEEDNVLSNTTYCKENDNYKYSSSSSDVHNECNDNNNHDEHFAQLHYSSFSKPISPFALYRCGEDIVTIDAHVGLLIGHKHFYVACLHTHLVYTLPVQLTQSAKLESNEFVTEFSLHEEEEYEKVSMLTWLPDDYELHVQQCKLNQSKIKIDSKCNNACSNYAIKNSYEAVDSNNNETVISSSSSSKKSANNQLPIQEEWRHGIFAISSSVGHVYLFAIAMHHSLFTYQQHSTPTKGETLIERIKLTFICRHEVKTYDEHANLVPVNTVDLMLQSNTCNLTTCETSTLPSKVLLPNKQTHCHVHYTIHLLVGCKDGTTRVYKCHSLPRDVLVHNELTHKPLKEVSEQQQRKTIMQGSHVRSKDDTTREQEESVATTQKQSKQIMEDDNISSRYNNPEINVITRGIPHESNNTKESKGSSKSNEITNRQDKWLYHSKQDSNNVKATLTRKMSNSATSNYKDASNKHDTQHDKYFFREEGVFFATNELTTLSVCSLHEINSLLRYNKREVSLQQCSTPCKLMWVVGDILGNIYQLVLEDAAECRATLPSANANTNSSKQQIDNTINNTHNTLTKSFTKYEENEGWLTTAVSPSNRLASTSCTNISPLTQNAMWRLLQCTDGMTKSISLAETWSPVNDTSTKSSISCRTQENVSSITNNNNNNCNVAPNVSKTYEDDCHRRFEEYLQSTAMQSGISFNNINQLQRNTLFMESAAGEEGKMKHSAIQLPSFTELHTELERVKLNNMCTSLDKLGQEHKLLPAGKANAEDRKKEVDKDVNDDNDGCGGDNNVVRSFEFVLPSLPTNEYQLSADVSYLFSAPILSAFDTTVTISSTKAPTITKLYDNSHEQIDRSNNYGDANSNETQNTKHNYTTSTTTNTIDKHMHSLEHDMTSSRNKADKSRKAAIMQSNQELTSSSTSYFDILTEERPSAAWAVSTESKKAWLHKRHEVLKEALRVQHYNTEARKALHHFNARSIQMFDLMSD